MQSLHRVEKSPSSIVQEAWRQEISGLRVPLEPRIPARYPLQMDQGQPLTFMEPE